MARINVIHGIVLLASLAANAAASVVTTARSSTLVTQTLSHIYSSPLNISATKSAGYNATAGAIIVADILLGLRSTNVPTPSTSHYLSGAPLSTETGVETSTTKIPRLGRGNEPYTTDGVVHVRAYYPTLTVTLPIMPTRPALWDTFTKPVCLGSSDVTGADPSKVYPAVTKFCEEAVTGTMFDPDNNSLTYQGVLPGGKNIIFSLQYSPATAFDNTTFNHEDCVQMFAYPAFECAGKSQLSGGGHAASIGEEHYTFMNLLDWPKSETPGVWRRDEEDDSEDPNPPNVDGFMARRLNILPLPVDSSGAADFSGEEKVKTVTFFGPKPSATPTPTPVVPGAKFLTTVAAIAPLVLPSFPAVDSRVKARKIVDDDDDRSFEARHEAATNPER